MLHDILLISEKHKRAARTIVKHVLDQRAALRRRRPAYKFILAISGESGAGKSELSHELGIALRKKGISVKVLHADNYYKVPPLERKAWRERRNFEQVGIEEYDWDLLNSTIDDFRNGRQSVMPCIDLVTQETDQLHTDFGKVELLIVDGLYAIGVNGVDLRVFIDLTWHETKKNQLVRGKESVDEERIKVLEMEHRSVSSLRNNADIIVDKSYAVTQTVMARIQTGTAPVFCPHM